jgi:hypothetical protein
MSCDDSVSGCGCGCEPTVECAHCGMPISGDYVSCDACGEPVCEHCAGEECPA